MFICCREYFNNGHINGPFNLGHTGGAFKQEHINGVSNQRPITATSSTNATQETLPHDKGVPQEDIHGPSSSKNCSSGGEPLSKRTTQHKQKRWHVDLEKVVDDFRKQQKESWEKFMEWEEKRMKLEAEEESKRRQEQHEHEIQLFSMLASMLSNPSTRWQSQEEFPHYPDYYDHQ